MSIKSMTAERLMHSVAVMACATTLSLFTTIATYATVGVATIGVGGCRSAPCTTFAKPAAPEKLRMAKVPARAS